MNKKYVILTIIFGLYFFTRFTNLTILPILTDEAIYLHWAQMIGSDVGQRFIPLIDGKTPLFMWLAIPFLWIIPDPLVAGRVLAVMFGFGILVGVMVSARLLFSFRASAIAGFFYLVTPFILTYDRLALVESMLLFWEVWLLVFLIALARRPRLLFALGTGFVVGAAFWTKPSGILFMLFFPLSGILVRQHFGRWLAYVSVGLIIGILSILSLRISPHFGVIFARSAEYTFPLEEILRRPREIFIGNGRSLIQWLGVNMTWPILLWSMLGIVFGLMHKERPAAFLFGCVLVLFLALDVTGRVLYPRYELGVTPPLLIAAAGFSTWLIACIRRKVSVGILIFGTWIALLPALSYNRTLLFVPANAPWVESDRWQYLSSWASGYGIAESISFFRTERESGPLTIGAEGRFGNPYDSLAVAFWNDPNVDVIPVDLSSLKWPANLEGIAGPVYYVVHKSRYPGLLPDTIKKVAAFEKPPIDSKTIPDELWILFRQPSDDT